jgi:hypothetical protein
MLATVADNVVAKDAPDLVVKNFGAIPTSTAVIYVGLLFIDKLL